MLLDVGGYPLVVLCAKRCASSDMELVVATSEERSDDPLVEVLEQHDIEYIRGDLEDVLSRFIKASEDLNDNDVLVRLTGDNPFVNAEFVKELVDFHFENQKEYSRTLSPNDGFPYGLSAEAVTVGALRKIYNSNPDRDQKEHVTLALTQKDDFALYKNSKAENLSHLRITIDTFDDYLRACRTFNACKNPLMASWQDLIKTLQSFDGTPTFKIPQKISNNKTQGIMALGTVQFGLPYGVANKNGQPELADIQTIIKRALDHGVNMFDTASAYGTSEQVLGQAIPKELRQDLFITTKLDPLSDIDENTPDTEIELRVEQSVLKSLLHLKLETLPVLMLHRWDHYEFKNGIIIKKLQELQKNGLIKKLGCSVQTPEEGLKAINALELTFIQMPFNIIDNRWKKSGFIDQVSKQADKHIQARSSLLQGLLTMNPDQWPVHKECSGPIHQWLTDTMKKYDRSSIIDLCYSYVAAQPWINSIVVGLETQEQLAENLELFHKTPLNEEQALEIDNNKLDVPQALLNPATWNNG
jgi:spore coat polysaccharide biosynthesis protein SpsF